MLKYKYTFLAGFLAGAALLYYLVRAMDSLALSMGPVGNEQKFDMKAWQNNEEGLGRMEMTDDLQIHYLRKGMKKKEVFKILGKPDGSGHYSSVYSDTSHRVSYDMGYVFLDPCTFDLQFSQEWKLIDYDINCN